MRYFGGQIRGISWGGTPEMVHFGVPGRQLSARSTGPTEVCSWRIARNPGIAEISTEPADAQKGSDPGSQPGP